MDTRQSNSHVVQTQILTDNSVYNQHMNHTLLTTTPLDQWWAIPSSRYALIFASPTLSKWLQLQGQVEHRDFVFHFDAVSLASTVWIRHKHIATLFALKFTDLL